MAEDTPVAEMVGDRLIVWDPEKGSEVYRKGYFGKPVGIPKPRTAEFDVPLTLDLIEGLYLVENGLIRVVKGPRGREVKPEQLRRKASKTHEHFSAKYMVYSDLRRQGFVVTPGIKFGCDFAVYERGPGVDHAPFLVEVKRPGDAFSAPDVVRAGRLATTVKKKFVFAIADENNAAIEYLVFKWWKA